MNCSLEEEYKDILVIQEDQTAFMSAMIKITRIDNEILIVNQMFFNEEMESYEACHRLSYLLGLYAEVNKDLNLVL